MPRDASGNYTLPAGNPVVTQTLITSAWANSTMQDIAAALTDSLSKQYGGTVTGAVTFNGITTFGRPVIFNDPSNQYVNKAGDTMSGPLSLVSSASLGLLGGRIYMQTPAGVGEGFFAADPSYGLGFINAAQTQWTMNVSNAGNMNVLGRVMAGSGGTVSPGAPHMFYGRVAYGFVGGQAGECGWQAGNGGSSFYCRGRTGGGIEYVNNTYTAVVASIDDAGNIGGGTVTAALNLQAGNGAARFQSDGNVVGPGMPYGDLYSALAQKVGPAVCYFNSGVNDFGVISNVNGALPNPWVVVGLSGPGNGTANAISIYGIQLRNYS